MERLARGVPAHAESVRRLTVALPQHRNAEHELRVRDGRGLEARAQRGEIGVQFATERDSQIGLVRPAAVARRQILVGPGLPLVELGLAVRTREHQVAIGAAHQAGRDPADAVEAQPADDLAQREGDAAAQLAEVAAEVDEPAAPDAVQRRPETAPQQGLRKLRPAGAALDRDHEGRVDPILLIEVTLAIHQVLDERSGAPEPRHRTLGELERTEARRVRRRGEVAEERGAHAEPSLAHQRAPSTAGLPAGARAGSRAGMTAHRS